MQGAQSNQRLLSLLEKAGYESGKLCRGTYRKTNADTDPVIFAKLDRAEPFQSALQVTWQDVTIRLSSTQEARLAAELIASLRYPC